MGKKGLKVIRRLELMLDQLFLQLPLGFKIELLVPVLGLPSFIPQPVRQAFDLAF